MFDRRQFIAASSALCGLQALPRDLRAEEAKTDEKSKPKQAESPRVAVIGLRSRGVNHLMGLEKHLVAVCDCDEKILSVRTKETNKRLGREVESFVDYRELLNSDKIDAVSIATPNHQHAIIGIAACQAGKDVYVEKPVSHNIWEGRQLAAAAEREGRVVQCGTQARSSKAIRQAHEYLQSGELGKVQYALATCYKARQSIGSLKYPLKMPKHVNFDLWCGPAEKQQIYRPSLHYDWHWDFNTGNGDLGNQGVHQMDIARWLTSAQGLPTRILSIGGRLGYEDRGDTPNTQVVLLDYPDVPIIFEVRGLPKSKQDWEKWKESMDTYRGVGIGVIVQCEKGYVGVSTEYGVAVALDNNDERLNIWDDGSENHYENWIAACKTQDPTALNAPIEEGHLSSALCHVGNISHQLGETAPTANIQSVTKEFQVGDVMDDSIRRMLAHLERNEVDLAETPLTLGAMLEMEGPEERFKDNPAANDLLTRVYREPFVVPAISAVEA